MQCCPNAQAFQTGRQTTATCCLCRVQSSLATFLVRLPHLPDKLNPVIRPLMESIRREESPLLQRLGPPCRLLFWSVVWTLLPARPGRPTHGRPLVTGPRSAQRQNEIQRRGAAQVLSLAAEHFGAALPERLPSLWEATVEPLLRGRNYIDAASEASAGFGRSVQCQLTLADVPMCCFAGCGATHNGEGEGQAASAEAQELVAPLQALEVIGPHLHPKLHTK
ncbi:hypothetical protein V5799_030487, partial [Amblyomma americanum]